MIILFQAIPQHQKYYSFVLESMPESNLKVVTNENDLLANLPNANLAIIDCKIANAPVILQKIRSTQTLSTPILVTCEQDMQDTVKTKIGTSPLFHYFNHGMSYEIFSETVNKILKQKNRISELSQVQFSKIKIDFFYAGSKLKTDVYIKLSESKYVKIYHRFQTYTADELKKLEDKGTKELFVRNKDFKIIMDDLISSLENKIVENPQSVDNTKLAVDCQKSVHEMINDIGLDEISIKLADYAINSTIDTINQNISLSKIWKQIVKNENFIAEHSMILSYLACAICNKTPWKGQANLTKLCLASFFHDLSLPVDDLARVSNISSPIFSTFNRKERNLIISHPGLSAKIISEIDGIPADVEKIILMHHEKFDGSGFPKGVNYKNISPLTAIFITALEMTYYLYEYGLTKENALNFLEEFTNQYNEEIPKPILMSFELLFGHQVQKKITEKAS